MTIKRIILHWTAGLYKPNSVELKHYHFLISGTGQIIVGKFKPENNLVCTTNLYAAHTGGGNTGSIGIALCGMLGFKSKLNVGSYPITLIQCQTMFTLCANLVQKYNISVNPDTLLTHYEFGIKHPLSSSAGKIDIIFLPPFQNIRQDKIGDFIRQNTLDLINKNRVSS